MIVIDASALIEVLLNTPASGKVTERLFARTVTLYAAHLLDVKLFTSCVATRIREMSVKRSEQAAEKDP